MEKFYLKEDCTLKFEVSGVSYLNEIELARAKAVQLNESILLETEPSNPFDKNAILVKTIDNSKIGYVNSDALESIHLLLKSGTKYESSICRKTEHDIPYIWVFISFEDIDVETDENNFGEDSNYVNEVYDIDIDDKDFYDIDNIRNEDDDAMFELDSKFLLEEIKCDEDITDWYNSYKEFKEYTVKYLKKRIKARVENEGYKFK